MDGQRIDLLDAIDFLGRHKAVGLQKPRVLFGSITHPDDGSIDDLLGQAPDAVTDLLTDNNPKRAKKLLETLDSRIEGITQKRNWGHGINGHHPISIAGQYLLTSDMPMERAVAVYDVLRLNGAEVGTLPEWMLPVTQPGHNFAHLDPVTNKTNKRAFQSDAMRFRQRNPEGRAMAYTPLALLEQSISKSAFNRPEEQKVRRKAASMIGRSPELLYALDIDPTALTPTGRASKRTYAQTASDQLGKKQMDEAIQAGYEGKSMSEIVTPNQFTKTFANKNRPSELRDRTSETVAYVKQELANERPGQVARMLRLARNRRVAPNVLFDK